MLRTSVILVASFGLLAGCATSSANSSNSNTPDGDAGAVNYDVGPPSDGGGAADGAGDGDGGGAGPVVKGRDSTTTRGAAVQPKMAKRISTSKPPKPEEPADPPPKRVGKVDPHGLLVEAFTIPAATEKLPEFDSLGAAKAVFISHTIDSNAGTPLAGLPKGVAAPVALRFTGSLNVLTEAEYDLCLTSIDGAQLLVEDTLIVDSDSRKAAAVDTCEAVYLAAGEYTVEVRSFHISGPIQLRLAWAEKDGTPAPVVSRDLYKPEGADDRVKAAKAK